jgi:hypothetical protein
MLGCNITLKGERMNEYKIYLKGGAVIEVSAIRVNFPDNKSKLLKIYISE